MKSWTRLDHLDKDEARVRTSWSLSDYGQPKVVSLKYPGPRAATVWPLLRTKWPQCQLTHDSLLCVMIFPGLTSIPSEHCSWLPRACHSFADYFSQSSNLPCLPVPKASFRNGFGLHGRAEVTVRNKSSSRNA